MPKKKIDIKPGDLVLSCNPELYPGCAYAGYVVEKYHHGTTNWVVEWLHPKVTFQVFHEDELMRCKRYVEKL